MLSACVDHWGHREGGRQMRVKSSFLKWAKFSAEMLSRGLGAEQEGELQKALSKQSRVKSKEPQPSKLF